MTHHQISKNVQAFIQRTHQHLIDGQWVDANNKETFPIYNPANKQIISTVARGDKHDIDAAVHAARSAFENTAWRNMTPSNRGKLIWHLAELLEQHADEFAELEALDNGKPFAVAQAADLPLAVDMFRYMAGWATKLEGSSIPISVPYAPDAEFLSYTLREPVGVVGQIIPWNFPLLMAAWKLAPALATGCTVVLKPAEETPLSALRLGELIMEAGFPKGVVNIVTGEGLEAGAPLAHHRDVDKVAFTGSTEVGHAIVKASSESNLKKITLELGGKSPNIIFPDADLEKAIPGVASAIFYNHGQCCCAGSRLYVHEEVYEQVLQGVSDIAKKMKVGDPFEATTEMGPLVSQVQFDRVTAYLDIGRTEGATTLAGGGSMDKDGYFVQPTVLADVNKDMKVVKEEIFGPVLCASQFKDIDDIVAQANDSEYGLAAGVWSKDISKAHHVTKQLRSGSVWINCYNIFDAALPFGGYKQSGWGREMGKEVLELYTETKAVTVSL